MKQLPNNDQIRTIFKWIWHFDHYEVSNGQQPIKYAHQPHVVQQHSETVRGFARSVVQLHLEGIWIRAAFRRLQYFWEDVRSGIGRRIWKETRHTNLHKSSIHETNMGYVWYKWGGWVRSEGWWLIMQLLRRLRSFYADWTCIMPATLLNNIMKEINILSWPMFSLASCIARLG